MSNDILLDVSSQGSPGVQGIPVLLTGGKRSVTIQAVSYGGDGKIVLKGSSNVDGSLFLTLSDSGTASGLAEYSSDSVVVIDFLPSGWLLRADLEISSGTASDVLVVLGN